MIFGINTTRSLRKHPFLLALRSRNVPGGEERRETDVFAGYTTRDISKLSQISLAITYNNFEISLVVFMPNITTNHAITYTNLWDWRTVESLVPVVQKVDHYPPDKSLQTLDNTIGLPNT